MAYWKAIGNGPERRRRRRTAEGVRMRRETKNNSNSKVHVIHEGVPKRPKQNYARFQEKSTGRVLVANYKLSGKERVAPTERMEYEFASGGVNYASMAEAEAAKTEYLAELAAKHGTNSYAYKSMKKAKPARTQAEF